MLLRRAAPYPATETDHLRMLTGMSHPARSVIYLPLFILPYLSCLLAARAMKNNAISTTARNAASKINQFVGFAILRESPNCRAKGAHRFSQIQGRPNRRKNASKIFFSSHRALFQAPTSLPTLRRDAVIRRHLEPQKLLVRAATVTCR
jgi:hypothetical protein